MCARARRPPARLVSITPEIQLAEPALDLRERARLRAEIDAIVAGLYDLSPAEFGHILTTFPPLDRDQQPLPDDFFVRSNSASPKLTAGAPSPTSPARPRNGTPTAPPSRWNAALKVEW